MTPMEQQIMKESQQWNMGIHLQKQWYQHKFISFLYTFWNIIPTCIPIQYKSTGKLKNDQISRG